MIVRWTTYSGGASVTFGPRARAISDKRLYIVDGTQFIHRAYHALPPLQTATGVPTGAVYGFAAMVLKLMMEKKPTHLAVVFDMRGKTFRHEIYGQYKATRSPTPDDLSSQFELTRRVTRALEIPILEREGVEADDVMASLTRRAAAEGFDVVIVSADKDLMQLVGPRVRLYDTMRESVYDEEGVEQKLGVGPPQLAEFLALVGDSSDNVPGVDGIGPKTAASLLGKHGNLEAVLAAAPTIKGKRGKTLVEQADRARLSLELVTLKDDVELELEAEGDPMGVLGRRQPDPERVGTLFHDLEFERPLDTAQKLWGWEADQGKVQLDPVGPGIDLDAYRTITEPAAAGEMLGRAQRAEALSLALFTAGRGNAPADRELVGLAVAWAPGEAAYLPVAHRTLGAGPQIAAGAVMELLEGALAGGTAALHIFDCKQAYAFFGGAGIALPAVAGDPMLASYLLDPSEGKHRISALARRELDHRMIPTSDVLGKGKREVPFDEVDVEHATRFACEQAEVTLRLAPRLAPQLERKGLTPLLHELEIPLARVLARMERTGVSLDMPLLDKLSKSLGQRLIELEREVTDLSGLAVNLGSPKQLQHLLFEHLGLEPIRKTKTGYSTDAEVLAELADQHPVAARIHEHRTLQKLKGTYVDPLPRWISKSSGRLHTSYNQAVAATGRLSSTDPNLQSIPVRTEVGSQIRRAFIAPPGRSLVSADYSQIELRVLAHLSRDERLLNAFRDDQDIHQITAADVFEVAPAAVTEEQRRVAKAVNFGVIYGQTAFGLSRQLKIARGTAKGYIESYFARYPGVATYMEKVIDEARRSGAARTLLGRIRPIPNLRSRNFAQRSAAERIARNTPIQGTAADIIKRAMLRCHDRLERDFPDAAMLLTVHDELVFESSSDGADVLARAMAEEMEQAYALDVRLKVDVGIGPSWGEAK